MILVVSVCFSLVALDCIFRLQYERSSLYIIQNLEPILQTYTVLVLHRALFSECLEIFSTFPVLTFYFGINILFVAQERAQLPTSDLSVVEAKLTWMVHIIAAILKIKQSTGVR